jgi:hypothetical protein
MITYLDGEIDRILRRRVCARCFEDLQKREAPGRTWEAYCPTCGDAWGGRHISRWTAERRGQRALAEALEVRVTLVDLFPNPHKGKPAEQILRGLGQ